MKIKTAELIGPTLDWAVAQCEGYECDTESGLLYKHKEPHFFKRYSTDWSQGGPIIELERLEIRCNDYEWQAFCFGFPVSRAHSGTRTWAAGPTPLIAAMRCLVASHLGDEVDVPDELK